MYCRSDSGFPELPGGDVFVILHGVVDVIMMLLVISCNSLIIYAILRYHRKLWLAGSLPCPNHAAVRLVLSLTTSDILVSLCTFYYLSFEYSCTVFTTLGAQRLPCLARFAPFMMAASASCFSLMALAVDRYIAVVHAMRYRDIMTKRVTYIFIFFTWFSGFLVGSSLFFWHNWSPTTPCEEFRIIPAYFITIVCVTVLIVAILVTAILHWRVHCVAFAAIYRKSSVGSNPTSVYPVSSMTTKSAQAIYLIVGCLLVLWTPITGVVIARSVLGESSPFLDVAKNITFTIYNISYFANSFIYAWKNSTIKLAILEVFGHERRRDSMVSARSTVLHSSVLTISEQKSSEVIHV